MKAYLAMLAVRYLRWWWVKHNEGANTPCNLDELHDKLSKKK